MIRRAVRGTGKTLISAGVLILLFVVYQLYGTGLTHDRHQRALRADFARQLAAATPEVTTVPGAPSTVAPPTTLPSQLADGRAIAAIEIPKIGLDEMVVEGVGVEELKEGVGHYSDTKMPGQTGNVAFAGHRTTYGHPFNKVDDLEAGDPIMVTTRSGTFRYEVMEKKIVTPDTVSVLDDTPDNRLTLTTCHPMYSAEKRLIIVAKLTSPALAPPVGSATDAATPAPPRARSLASDASPAGLSGGTTTDRPAIAWGILAATVWLGAWAIGRWSGRRWTAYFVGAPVFLLLLFMFFENFARLLPANV